MPLLTSIHPPGAASYIKSTCKPCGSPKSYVVAICSQPNAKSDVLNARRQTEGRIDSGNLAAGLVADLKVGSSRPFGAWFSRLIPFFLVRKRVPNILMSKRVQDRWETQIVWRKYSRRGKQHKPGFILCFLSNWRHSKCEYLAQIR